MQNSITKIDQIIGTKDYKRALVIITKELRHTRAAQDRAELLFRRAHVRLIEGRPDEALEDIETGVALYDGHIPQEIKILWADAYFARFELAVLGFSDRQDTERALTLYIEVLEADAQPRAWVYFQMGRIKLSHNATSEAETLFQKALEAPADPLSIRALAHERLGFIALIEHRNPEKALQHLNWALDHYPPEAEPGWVIQLYIRISRAHLENQKPEAALKAARRALRDIQNGSTADHRAALPEAHMAMANVLAVMPGHEADAIEHYMRFLQSSKRPPGIDVTWSQVHEKIGQLSFQIERYQQAITAFEKALDFNPYHPWETSLRYQLARCFYRMRAYEKTLDAIGEIERNASEENTPVTDWRCFNLKGNALFALERYAEAAAAYRVALDLAPPSGGDMLQKTHIYLRFSEELSHSNH